MPVSFNVKTDIDEAMNLLQDIDGNQKTMRKRILTGIGSAVKTDVKKKLPRYLHKQTGTMARSMTSKYSRRDNGVVVTNNATDEKTGVRYPWVLAAGTLRRKILPKNGKVLTFKIGDKWIRKHEVSYSGINWLEEPAERYMASADYKQKLENLVKREIVLAEKRAERQAQAGATK